MPGKAKNNIYFVYFYGITIEVLINSYRKRDERDLKQRFSEQTNYRSHIKVI